MEKIVLAGTFGCWCLLVIPTLWSREIQYVLTTAGRIAIKLGLQRMAPNDFGDPLTFHAIVMSEFLLD